MDVGAGRGLIQIALLPWRPCSCLLAGGNAARKNKKNELLTERTNLQLGEAPLCSEAGAVNKITAESGQATPNKRAEAQRLSPWATGNQQSRARWVISPSIRTRPPSRNALAKRPAGQFHHPLEAHRSRPTEERGGSLAAHR